MTARSAGWVRGGRAGKASRGAAQPPHAPEAPAALAGVLASQLARYRQCLAEFVVLVRPESGACGEDWARLRRERAQLEAELLRRQQAHQAVGSNLGAPLYDFAPLAILRPPAGPEGPAGPTAGSAPVSVRP